MRQCDIIRFLFRDLKESTSNLILGEYPNIFEEEIQEHYPFEEEISKWLLKLYQSEKYNVLEGADRSLLFEKSHPFLFVRDLATLNNWRGGYHNAQRRDQVTGLLFSMTEDIAFETTIALCQPSLVDEPKSKWFDANQAMANLDFNTDDNKTAHAWKACAYYYLYMHFTSKEQPPNGDELAGMLNPFRRAVDYGFYNGDIQLKHQCGIVNEALAPEQFQTLNDAVR